MPVPTTNAPSDSCGICLMAEATGEDQAGTFGFFTNLLNTDGFPPRWECGEAWTPAHGWLHIVSDFAIFGAYFAIPVVLAYFILRRKDIPFPPILWLFVAFIALCGIGHLVEGTIFWTPWYRLSGAVKGATAIVSWITVIALVWIVPLALNLPGLAMLNEKLKQEAAEREKVEQSLRERANELEEINQELVTVSRTTVGREDRVIELKKEVNKLLERLGEQSRYKIPLEK